MTQIETEAKNASANKAQVTSNINSKTSERKERPLTKVIVRRLPPNLDQESFFSIVSPIPDYDYMYSVKGDASLGEHSFSRVYINFTNAEDVFAFKEKFDNYVFVNNRGHEYPAVVEFASFQKIPKKRGKTRADAKCGTIESDPYYLEFLEALKTQPTQEEKPEYSYQFTTENKDDQSTPLLEYIKQKRVERQRIREEKREERKKRELERKKFREDERKKRYDEKSPVKTVVIKANYTGKTSKDDKEGEYSFKDTESPDENVKEKPVLPAPYKSKERKYEDKKLVFSKSKYSRQERRGGDYADKKSEYKNRREERGDYKSKHYDDGKKGEGEQKQFTGNKKVKKYSERREERKLEALKAAEQRKEEEEQHNLAEKDKTSTDKAENNSEDTQERYSSNDSSKDDSSRMTNKENDSRASKENDPRAQRRIRNKDRPTMALYQPGMLSKRKQVDSGDSDSKDTTVNNGGKD